MVSLIKALERNGRMCLSIQTCTELGKFCMSGTGTIYLIKCCIGLPWDFCVLTDWERSLNGHQCRAGLGWIEMEKYWNGKHLKTHSIWVYRMWNTIHYQNLHNTCRTILLLWQCCSDNRRNWIDFLSDLALCPIPFLDSIHVGSSIVFYFQHVHYPL